MVPFLEKELLFSLIVNYKILDDKYLGLINKQYLPRTLAIKKY